MRACSHPATARGCKTPTSHEPQPTTPPPVCAQDSPPPTLQLWTNALHRSEPPWARPSSLGLDLERVLARRKKRLLRRWAQHRRDIVARPRLLRTDRLQHVVPYADRGRRMALGGVVELVGREEGRVRHARRGHGEAEALIHWLHDHRPVIARLVARQRRNLVHRFLIERRRRVHLGAAVVALLEETGTLDVVRSRVEQVEQRDVHLRDEVHQQPRHARQEHIEPHLQRRHVVRLHVAARRAHDAQVVAAGEDGGDLPVLGHVDVIAAHVANHPLRLRLEVGGERAGHGHIEPRRAAVRAQRDPGVAARGARGAVGEHLDDVGKRARRRVVAAAHRPGVLPVLEQLAELAH
mmetsp:Transcript_32485/g.85811  ORF Transcript_32485/g.85811 Transcript_32485/m.85811 type:complete len:351 (-) Transcript_32485:314-1366(-)